MSKKVITKEPIKVSRKVREKMGCMAGQHPRDKVFTYHKINNPNFQREIDMGNVVAGCRLCGRTYIVKKPKESTKENS